MRKVKLSNIINSLESGGRPQGGALTNGEGVFSIGAEHLNGNGGFDFTSKKYVPLEFYNSLKKGKVDKDDILIVKDGATTGKISHVDENFPFEKAAVNEHVFNLKIDKTIANPKFVFQYLKSISGNREILKDFRGSTVGGISRGFVEFVHLPIFSLEHQTHIANILTQAETLIAQRKQSIALLDEYVKSSFLEMFGDPVRNEKEFTKGKIGDIVTDVKYGTSSPGQEEGQYPYLRMNNITTDGYWDFSKLKYIDVIEDEKEKYIVRKGDLLFNRTNSKELVGKTAVFNEQSEMIIAGYLIRVRLKESINPWYLWGYLNSLHGKQTLFGMCKTIVGMANINAQELQKIKILIPPISLQNQFAQIVQKTEALKAQYKTSLKELENLYGALSQKAFKGEIEMPAVAHTTAKIISLIPENKKAFAKQVLGGKIVSIFKEDKNFTHIKFQKLQFLAEHIIEEDLNWNYYRQAAGPYDNKFMHSVIFKLKSSKWFEEINYKFKPLAKCKEIDKYYDGYFSNKQKLLENLFTTLLNATEKLCEAIATIYAIWNNQIILKKDISKASIELEFFEWSNRKKQVFSPEEFSKAYDWMVDKHFVPTGFGYLIKEKKK